MIVRIGFNIDSKPDWQEVATIQLEPNTWPGSLAEALHELADEVFEAGSFEQVASQWT